MGNSLAGGVPVIRTDGEPTRLEVRREPLPNLGDQLPDSLLLGWRKVVDAADVLPGNHERVAGRDREGVRQRVGVLGLDQAALARHGADEAGGHGTGIRLVRFGGVTGRPTPKVLTLGRR